MSLRTWLSRSQGPVSEELPTGDQRGSVEVASMHSGDRRGTISGVIFFCIVATLEVVFSASLFRGFFDRFLQFDFVNLVHGNGVI